MYPTDQQIKEFQKIYKKEYGVSLNEKDATESAYNLLNFLRVLYDGAKEDFLKKEKLKKHPKGFSLEDGKTYSCLICHKYISGKDSWYDKYGNKCLICQNALDKKVIPGYICHNRDSWYGMWELKSKFGIHSSNSQEIS